jgi:O-antigen/teichoic acid export membrane protein
MTDNQPPNSTTINSQGEALGARVGHGMAWLIVITLLNKGLTSIAQVVLGWQLSAEDFSVYAVATAFAGFIVVCKEAGMRELIIQRGKERYEQYAGATFWLAFWYNVVMAGVIAAVAFPLALYLKKPDFFWVIILLGVAVPVGTAGGMIQSKMRLHLDFARSSMVAFWSNLVRQITSIGFALGGLGALSLAIPAVLASALESVITTRKREDRLWQRPAAVQQWPELLRQGRWLMFGSVTNFAVDWGPFMVLMPLGLLTATENGYFYFGYSITAQVGVLLGVSVLLVLMPALTRLTHDEARLGQAVLRSLRTLMLVASIASLGLAACMPALETLLWHGKWSASVWATVILGVFFPWRITFGLTAALLMAQGRFKLYSWLTLLEGAGLTACCCIAALIEPTATSVAIGAGLWLFVSRAIICMWLCKQLNLPRRRLALAMSGSWILAIFAGAAGWAADHYIPLQSMLAQHVPFGSDRMKLTLIALLRVIMAGTITSVIFLTLARVFLHEGLLDVVRVAPPRLRKPLGLLFGVRPEEQVESDA